MLGFLFFVVGVLVVAALLFLAASLMLGRGETQPPEDLDRSPVELPDDRPVTSEDVLALRISVAFRGYRMSEVDWLLEQFGLVLDERDAEIARLKERVAHPVDDLPQKTLQAADDPTDPGGPTDDEEHRA